MPGLRRLCRNAKRRKPAKKKVNGRKEGEARSSQKKQQDDRAEKGFEEVLETIDGLFSERSDEDKIWGSMVKQALKRRKPGFSEGYHGFRSFCKMLEQMETLGMITLEHDKKSGSYIITGVN